MVKLIQGEQSGVSLKSREVNVFVYNVHAITSTYSHIYPMLI